jgi:hypothetical protein
VRPPTPNGRPPARSPRSSRPRAHRDRIDQQLVIEDAGRDAVMHRAGAWWRITG